MEKFIYESPAIEVLEVEIENAVLSASGEDSDVLQGW
jgi:hypothetical protein